MTSKTHKYSGPQHAGPDSTSPYPVSRLAAPHDLVSMAEEIQRADQMLSSVVGGKLEQIARQMRALQEEARRTLEQAKHNATLHRAACGFRKRPGRVYHLYEKPGEELYFSMLSPDEWGGQPPHPFRGSYRLEADMSWTPAAEIGERDMERRKLAAFLPSKDT